MIKRFLATLCIFSLFQGYSQSFSKLYKTYKAKYPEAHQVILEKSTHVTIDIENDSLKIYQENFEDILLLNPSASFDVKESISTSSFYGLSSFEAATLVYEKGKYREVKVEKFTEKENSGSNFYDDTKILSFKYPNLEQGARKTLKYKEEIKNPRFINSEFFASNHPIVKQAYSIEASKDVLLKFKEFNLKSVQLEYSKKSSKGKNIYRWLAEDIEAMKLEGGTPDLRYFIPHLIPIIESYTVNNKETTLTKSTKDLYNWYYSLVKDVNTKDTDTELINLVQQLIEGKKSNLEKVKTIYYWVQENIKYIAFEYALGGFIPREANDIFNKKYGDCKDNSSILFEMLKIAGLEGNLTWIGTRDVPYSYHELPTPAVDNHMILSYTEKGTTYYLDATGRYLPIDFPSNFIQGKEALIGKGEGSFEVKKVPIVSELRNTIVDSAYFKLNANYDLEGSGKLSLNGYPKIDLFFHQEQLTSKEQRTDYYKGNLQKGNNNFIVKDFKEHNSFSYDKPFILDYNFVLEKYVQHFENEVYVNLNLNTELLNFKSSKERKFDREFEYKARLSYINTLEIPENMIIDYIPEEFSIHTDLIDIDINYLQGENTLTHKLNISQKFILITPEQQNKINKIVDQVQQQFKEVIVLKVK